METSTAAVTQALGRAEVWLRAQDPVLLVLAALGLLIALLLVRLARSAARAGAAGAPVQDHLATLSAQVAEMSRAQAQMGGGLTSVAEAQSKAQITLMHTLERRLEEVQRQMADSLHGSTVRTTRSLAELQTRLATIDAAQANIERLSGDVLGLQDILSNKQTRGAFGEIQLQDLVSQALPAGAFAFQQTLSNGRRADCVIDLPQPPGPLVIDSKFPLEAYEALIAATSETEKTAAARAFRGSVRAHLRAIAERYIIPGETGDGALMFLPSEAVYAELHANFGDLVREGFAMSVWTVSPTTCMATLTTLRAVLRDARMRAQAGAIRAELAHLGADLTRLDQRVANLDRHFGQAVADLAQVRTSTARAGKRAARLEEMEFEADPAMDPGAERDRDSGADRAPRAPAAIVHPVSGASGG